MNRTDRDVTRHNHALGEVLRGAIDDVVSADERLSSEDVVAIVSIRLEVAAQEKSEPAK
jgi:hypothetical protein